MNGVSYMKFVFSILEYYIMDPTMKYYLKVELIELSEFLFFNI